jgi:hypothetical protein
MPADDIVAKTIPAMGVVVIAGRSPGFAPASIVPVVNRPAGIRGPGAVHPPGGRGRELSRYLGASPSRYS